ncbi:MAG: hypothetical protein ACOYN0_18460 [Phycisphaerales bacterium]
MSYSTSLDVLSNVRIASPCTARWEDMAGDEKQRHCAQCNLDVFNFSAMTGPEAAAIAERAREGRVCARFYRRTDGTMLLADCPVGLAAVRRRVRAGVARAVGAFTLLIGASLAMASGRGRFEEAHRVRRMQPFAWLSEKLNSSAVPVAPPIMGEICIPTPPAPGASNGNTP